MSVTRAALAVLCLLLASGCITRPVKEKVFDDGYTEVTLRSFKRGMQVVEKGFDHPAQIAAVRMSHILSRIDLRWQDDDKKERQAAIPLDTLYTIGAAMAQGLAKAGPNDEVVVQSIRRGRHMGLFERQFLTSLLCYMRDDVLYIHISRSDWAIPPRRELSERLPETHVGEHPLRFRLVTSKGMSMVDPQAVAVQWRDAIFRRPTRTRILSSGRVVRREILMESPVEDDTVFAPQPVLDGDLSPAQLRALADLEEAREAGEVSEAQYQARRRLILSGETEERTAP